MVRWNKSNTGRDLSSCMFCSVLYHCIWQLANDTVNVHRTCVFLSRYPDEILLQKASLILHRNRKPAHHSRLVCHVRKQHIVWTFARHCNKCKSWEMQSRYRDRITVIISIWTYLPPASKKDTWQQSDVFWSWCGESNNDGQTFPPLW